MRTHSKLAIIRFHSHGFWGGVSHLLEEVMNCRDLGWLCAGTKNFGGFAVGRRALIMPSVERRWHISCLMLWRDLVLFHVFICRFASCNELGKGEAEG